MAAIYLAGKIGPLDWREEIVPGLQDAWGDSSYSSRQWGADDAEWPVLPNGALGQYDYTGPYFVDTCTHSDTGCGQSDHRAGSECEGDSGERSVTLQRCLRAIDRADIVFAWLSDLTAYGTLTEIGYAKGRGKIVIVASPDKPGTVDAFYDDTVHGADRHSLNMNHLWFAFTLADKVITTATPLEALKQFAGLNVQLESPIEEAFWREYLNARPAELDGLTSQHPVLQGRYRIDFALPEEKIGIELDGYQWHSSPQAFTQDRARQRQLDLAGWRIIRFSGAEINNNVSGCLRQAAEIVASIRGAY